MAYIVTEACIKCKYTDCVEVCPVDCFYEGENMLVINPTECIDCGVCEPECPVEAIKPEALSDASKEEKEYSLKYLELNKHFSEEWSRITSKKPPLLEAELYKNVKDKYQYFSPKPGKSEESDE